MSTGGPDDLRIALNYHPVQLNGRLRYRVSALLGGELIHMAQLDLASERSREVFLRRIQDSLTHRPEAFHADELRQSLLRQAGEASGEIVSERGEGHPGVPVISAADVLQAFGIEVLGETDDHSIVIYAASTGKKSTIKKVDRWSYLDMLQMLGEVATERLWLSNGDPPADTFRPQELQAALALEASRVPRITQANTLGQGVWRCGRRFVVVSGRRAYTYDGQQFRRLTRPRAGHSLIDFDAARSWAPRLTRRVRDMNVSTASGILRQLQELLARWNWTHPADPAVAAALVTATFIQACWTWRPLITVTGESDSGKSTLFAELLKPIFGDWVLMGDRSSEAGLRQAMKHDSSPVVIDEFDSYSHRDRVLELFRTASRGGKILRGTRDQMGLQFRVIHMAWFGAIETGEIWGPDRNRRIRLEMRPPRNRGSLRLPGTAELAELGRQLAAAALWAAPRAVQLADAIKRTPIVGIHGRLVENYSVPAAMASVLSHGREVADAFAVAELQRMLAGRQNLELQGEPDQVRLLRDILTTIVTIPVPEDGGHIHRNVTVGALLRANDNLLGDHLSCKGITIVRTRPRDSSPGRRYLFIAHDAVRRYLLQQTQWANMQIDQVLQRLPGARRQQQHCGGNRTYGISLPWPDCLACLESVLLEHDNVICDGDRS